MFLNTKIRTVRHTWDLSCPENVRAAPATGKKRKRENKNKKFIHIIIRIRLAISAHHREKKVRPTDDRHKKQHKLFKLSGIGERERSKNNFFPSLFNIME